MSEDVKVEQPEAKPEGEQQQLEKFDELVSRVESVEGLNQRLLDESKKWKTKYQDMRSEIEEEKTQKMQEKNDFKGLYEKTLDEANALRDAVKMEKKSSLETTLKYEVAKNARDAEDTDLLLAAIKLKKKDLLGYDNDTGTWKGVGDAIDDLRVSNPGLFVQDKPGMVNGRPQSAVVKDKTVEELVAEDPNSVLNNALKELLK